MTDPKTPFWTPARALAAIGAVLLGVLLCTGCVSGDETYHAGFIVAATENPAPGEAWALLNGDKESEYILIAPAYKDRDGNWDYADKNARVVKSREFIERQYPHKVGYAAPELLGRRW